MIIILYNNKEYIVGFSLGIQKYLLSSYYMPGTVQDDKYILVSKKR